METKQVKIEIESVGDRVEYVVRVNGFAVTTVKTFFMAQYQADVIQASFRVAGIVAEISKKGF